MECRTTDPGSEGGVLQVRGVGGDGVRDHPGSEGGGLQVRGGGGGGKQVTKGEVGTV